MEGRVDCMKKISTYIWEYKWIYLLMLIGLFGATTMDMLSPLLIQKVVDDVLIGRDMSMLTWLLFGFL